MPSSVVSSSMPAAATRSAWTGSASWAGTYRPGMLTERSPRAGPSPGGCATTPQATSESSFVLDVHRLLVEHIRIPWIRIRGTV